MKTGTVLLGEVFDSLTVDEHRDFMIAATLAAYEIHDQLERDEGKPNGRNRHLLLGDPLDYLASAVERVRLSTQPQQINDLQDLVKHLSRFVALKMKDRLRDAAGDTRKVDPITGNKIFKPQIIDVAVQFHGDDRKNFDVIDHNGEPLAGKTISLRLEDLDNAAKIDRFLDLLIEAIAARGHRWSARLSAIIKACRNDPNLFEVEEGRTLFRIEAIADTLGDKPQNISNALRHLAELAEKLGDPNFEALIKKAATAKPAANDPHFGELQ